MSKHSPLPWEVRDNDHYTELAVVDGGQIGDLCASKFYNGYGNDELMRANAALIVEAVNSYASLKEENEELVKALEWFANPENWREEQLSEGYVYSAEWKVGSCPIDLARAALSKARG